MQRISIWLWLAVGGATLQFSALGSNFYVINGKNGGTTKDAWLGIPHASDLILASAVVTIVALTLSARGRSPVSGRTLGTAVAVVGGLATAQLAYRMAVPPFGCLTYNCGATAKSDVTLLAGIWIGLIGCALALIGGLGHALSAAASRTPATPDVSDRQTGMTPWLGLAGLGLVVSFVGPFTFLDAYRVEGFMGSSSSATWGGWLSAPHTSSLVLAATIVGVTLVVAAARRRSLLSPSALGATLAVLGFVIASRELFRMLQPPFSSAGGQDTAVGTVTILAGFWIGFVAAGVACVAATVQAVLYYRESVSDEAATTSPAQGITTSTGATT
ncbi:MAG: hypothetical protein WKF73_19685 [Nocardioidaceae bacterium]